MSAWRLFLLLLVVTALFAAAAEGLYFGGADIMLLRWLSTLGGTR